MYSYYYPQNYTPYYNTPAVYGNPELQQVRASKASLNNSAAVKTSIFYFNDYHGCSSKMGELKTASDSFSKAGNKDGTDTFKLAAGDILKGNNSQNNSMWVEFLNRLGLDFSAIGNHELDQGSSAFNDNISRADYKYVSSNIEINPYGTLSGAIQNKKIVSSWIENRNGHLYGFVGLTPSDAKYRKPGKKLNNSDIRSYDTQKSLEEVQKEVDKLKQRGVNKIILLSHFDDRENKIAKSISGIDIIISGHKHRTYRELVPGKNLLKSPAAEPVIKVECGRDGKYVGTLDVVFDENGIIVQANNNLQETVNIPEDISVLALENKYRKRENSLGILKNSVEADGFKENTVASFVADAVREKSKADIVLIPGGNIYEGLERGILTTGDIERVLPFSDSLFKTVLTEKDIIDALKNGAKPSEDDDSETNILQTSGLKYTVTPDREIKDVYFEAEDGKLVLLDSKNPGTEKKFNVVYGGFLLKGKNGFISLKKEGSEAKQLGWSEKEAAIEYIKSRKFIPFSVNPQGRIKVEK